MKRSIARIIVKFVFEMLTEFFEEEINEQYIKERLIELVGHLKRVAKALLDRNKDNIGQLKEIWLDARPSIVAWGFKEALEEVDKRVHDPVTQDRLKQNLRELAEKLANGKHIKLTDGNRKTDI